MLSQYRRIKAEHKGEILFFRLGDFYEMFAEDAVEVSSLLNLTLTSRNGLPMCGVPYHAYRSYIARLLKVGKKVAVCEQLSEAPKGRGIIERRVIEVITPGTTVDEDYLEKGTPNYLAALAGTGKFFSFAYLDLSTGEFRATAFPPEQAGERLRQELERLQSKEMVVQESLLLEYPEIAQGILERPGLVVNRWADWLFDTQRSRELLLGQFHTTNLRGFGLDDNSPEIVAAGAILDYLSSTAQSLLPHIKTIIPYGENEFVAIDEASQRNLELIRNLRDGELRYSLFEVMDETKTAMGRRLLRRRILHPLRDLAALGNRLDMVETFYRNQSSLSALREVLGKTPDLERLISRLAMDKAHGKDMVSVKNALVCFETVIKEIKGNKLQFESPDRDLLDADSLTALRELRRTLEKGICDEPSILLSEGKLIRPKYDERLDELHKLRNNGRNMVEAYLEKERAETDIPLKLRYNRLIGYFFEVTNMHLSKVPVHFIRRQGIAGAERFTTDRLAALESDINGAQEKIIEMEKAIFLDIRETAKKLISQLSAAAARIQEIDAAQSLARAATIHGWVRPELNGSRVISIKEGRHPVVEAHLPPGEFTPNDVELDGEGVSFILITGPNMAGKSTYLREAALITLMAQVGSFVPAREAKIGLVDRVYCRVGAQDNLARGESTFLVEMNETAHILHTATPQSLVIMDEVGRGTGTKDGISIAWAVSEELLENIRCRTLFATHYHELSLLSHPRMTNRSMEVIERGGELVFVRKLIEGASEESYGLNVASLAGIPQRVLIRAQGVMERLREGEHFFREALVSQVSRSAPGAGDSAPAPSGSACSKNLEYIGGEILSLDENTVTPLEALTRIHGWKALLEGVCAELAEKPPESRKKPRREQSEPELF